MSTSGRGISGPSPALEARILRERRSEEKRRKRQARAAGASFEPVTVKVLGVERRLLFWLQENRTKLWAARQALNVTSATPFQDICTITSVSACIGLFAIGFPFFWMCAYAAIAFFAVNLFLRYPRPQTLDQRLVPLTRTSQDVICQEAFSAAVVFGTVGMYLSEEEGALPSINGEATDVLLFFDWAYVVQQLLLLGLVVFVSWTRVVACAKFVSALRLQRYLHLRHARSGSLMLNASQFLQVPVTSCCSVGMCSSSPDLMALLTAFIFLAKATLSRSIDRGLLRRSHWGALFCVFGGA
eukprot:INCI15740.4.p1 GENE.INCI15740.4~~INCI15740.4.p1  ORF type:complete len:299 (-),score=31.37 INCI15740.4:604-1500(-)